MFKEMDIINLYDSKENLRLNNISNFMQVIFHIFSYCNKQ
jgi:hypothetical protein